MIFNFFKKEYAKHFLKKWMTKLRTHRGLNDLLTYMMQLDGSTILHKDGALSRHFIYVAHDADSALSTTLDFISDTWKNSFSFLGDNWMIETNVLSQPFSYAVKSREFPEVVSALFDDERREQFQNQHYFTTTHYLSISWKPDSELQSQLKKFALNDKTTAGDSDWDKTLGQFNQKVTDFINYLKRALISIRPLENDELSTFLNFCISGHTNTLKRPYQNTFLDSYVSTEDFIAGFEPKIGKHFIKVLALDDLPNYSTPALLKSLQYFPVTYRWSSRFIPLEKLTAVSYLKKYERSWSSKAIGVFGVIREAMELTPKRDQDAQSTADQLKQAQIENSSGALSYGFYNSVLILMHENQQELAEAAKGIISHIQKMDFKVRDESVNATEGYLGSIPSHGDYNLRKMMVDTNYIGHAMPTSSLYQGEKKSPCDKAGYLDQPPLLFTATEGSRPFMLNCHVGDVGHTAILGPTGMGKSTLIGAMTMGHRQYTDSRIIVLDKDYSNRLLIKSLGGQYYDLAKDECQLSPLARVKSTDDYAIDQALTWLKSCSTLQDVAVTPERQALLRESLIRLSGEKQAFKNLSHLSVQDEAMRLALNTLNSGRFKTLLNGTTPQFSNADVIGFEMSSFLQSYSSQKQDLNIAVIHAIFNELDEIFKDKRPTLLILEEAWLYLRHPIFREKLTDWFKTLRKANVSVIFVSQDLDDIVQSDSASVIQSSCMTRIYLPNPSVSESRVAQQYLSFGFNEQEIQIIKNAIPKQDYFYQSSYGKRLFRLDLNPLSKAFLCISDKKDFDQFDALYDSKNPEWVLSWLRYRQLDQWADFAKSQYFGK